MRLLFTFILFTSVSLNKINAQEITLFNQFNGRYDYTAIGNTLNQAENNISGEFCEILPNSSATLNLPENTTVIAAYLYWAGSGTGDTSVKLNEINIEAETTYIVNYNEAFFGDLPYFSCFANITNLVIEEGNTNYNFSELDISETLNNNSRYCANRTNFAGWSIYVIYEEETLPLNQINLFQGLEIINRNVQEKTVTLNNINVLDNENAKIGFLAWEGDNYLNYGESLSINNNVLSNPPLNLSDNAFNGTNTFTNSTSFYNADLDVYNIENNIAIGDTSVNIKLTTGGLDANGNFQADLIILNNIITVLNSQLPDATVTIDNYFLECGSREIEVAYTIYNTNSTDSLPANTPIAIYANGNLVAQTQTQNTIAINANESNTVVITIPSQIEDNIDLIFNVDDNGTNTSTVIELNESNNTSQTNFTLIPAPEITVLTPITNCNIGFNKANFNLTQKLLEITTTANAVFYTNLEDLSTESNPIINPNNFQNSIQPQPIYIRVNNLHCYNIYLFNLITENCPPYIPQGFSPNNDTVNDWFNIQGLYNIFFKHELLIYNRYGTLIFTGNNDKHWDGKANRGINNLNRIVPTGTYFYVLHLNYKNSKPLTGWIYLNK